ncbi:hypothetical protein JI435_419280, partial [Parastagonospora nodorum SN15]
RSFPWIPFLVSPFTTLSFYVSCMAFRAQKGWLALGSHDVYITMVARLYFYWTRCSCGKVVATGDMHYLNTILINTSRHDTNLAKKNWMCLLSHMNAITQCDISCDVIW